MLSCNQTKKISVLDKVNPKDTSCIRELDKAQKDIEKGILVFCDYNTENIGGGLRCSNEMDSLLQKYNIISRVETSPDVGVSPSLNYHCYCDLMDEQIIEKYGSKFIDSLIYFADSLYVLKHLDVVYENHGWSTNWDKPAVYPGDKYYSDMNHSGLQDAFDKVVEYPSKYRYKKGEYSWAYINAFVYIDEKGKAQIKNIRCDFFDYATKERDYNKKHNAYFESLIIPLIENITWRPAKIKNISVKSTNNILIYLK